MKKEEEIKEKCTCGCNCDENCDCGCQDGEECTCHDCECGCGCDDGCDCRCGLELPPLEEKLVLVGKKGDKKTKEATEYLDKKGVQYKFLDLNEDNELLSNINEIDAPSLLLVQTVVSGIAPGLDGIKDAFGD